MKVLVTGAGGMLGSSIVPAFEAAGFDVVATDLRPRVGISSLDVRIQSEVYEAVNNADLVLHLAAETDLEVCERYPDHAYLTNQVGTTHVARATARSGIPIVYIGTAGIFDGEKDGPYTELDDPHPVNVYGSSKWLGEQEVAINERRFIVRAGWMIGGKDRDHKFVAKILGQIASGAETIYAVTDKIGTPTYTRDFATNLIELIRTGRYGTYHMVCKGSGSRYDVAKEICRIKGRSDIDVVPVDSSYFEERFFAPRPRNESMVNAALNAMYLNMMRPWQVALEDYLR